MPILMRAKLMVSKVEPGESKQSQNVEMVAVFGHEPYGPNGESEDNTYARWTPTANLKMTINNPALQDKLKLGQKLYVDFTSADIQTNETKHYTDGTIVTGPGPLPRLSPAQQAAEK